MEKLLIPFFTLFVFVICSCTSDSESDLTNPVPIIVKYNTDIRPIIQANCIECHNDPLQGGAPMPLLTYEEVKEAIINRGLINRITSNDPSFRMPFGRSPLPQSKIDLIITWKNNNYPE